MRVLITGGDGQLGRDVQRALDEHEVRGYSHSELDVCDARSAGEAVESFGPEVVIHAAALTDTTRCELEPEAAFAANASGARNVAVACARSGAAMVYVSTNEVFDGERSEPYAEDDGPRPMNEYGRSKLAGERQVGAVLDRHYIVRTAWLYGRGGDHFVAKILRAAERGDAAGVVDETATPTWTRDLAVALGRLIETNAYGIYHLTNAGQASRFEWAEEALRLAGMPDGALRRMTTAELRASLPKDTVAPRKPPFSALANQAGAALGIELRPWREALAEYWTQSGQ